jgi:hypothetical protein
MAAKVKPSSEPIRVFSWNVAEVSQESDRRFANVQFAFEDMIAANRGTIR